MFDQRDVGLELDLAFKSQIDAWSLNLKCLQLSYKRWSENVEISEQYKQKQNARIHKSHKPIENISNV